MLKQTKLLVMMMTLFVSLTFTQTDKSIKWWDVGSNQFKVLPIPFIPMDSTIAGAVATPVAGRGNIFIGLGRKMYAKWVDGTVTEIGGGGGINAMTKQAIVDSLNKPGTNWLDNNTWSFKTTSINQPSIIVNNPGAGHEAIRLTRHMFGSPSFVSGEQSITFAKDTVPIITSEARLGSLRFRKEPADSGAHFTFMSKLPNNLFDPPVWVWENVPLFTIHPSGYWEMWKRPFEVTARKMTFNLPATMTANRSINWADASGTPAVSATSPLVLSTSTGNLSLSTVGVAFGGTGTTSLTVNGLVVGNGTNPVNVITAGAANTFLQSNGSAWSARQIYYTAVIPASTDEVDVSITGLSATSVVYASWGKAVTSPPLGSLYVVSTGANTCKIRCNTDELNDHNIVVTVVSW